MFEAARSAVQANILSFRTVLGASWLVSSRLAGRGVDIVTLFFLARALTPADFGLTALAGSVIAVLDTVLEIPLSQALTRLRAVDQAHLDTAFTLGLMRGGALSAVVLAAAWPLAAMYRDARLTPLICALAAGPIARSVYSPAMVKYVREISFGPMFSAEIGGKVIAALLAIASVRAGAGYWAIAINSITSPLFATMASYVIAPYRPSLSFARFADFSSFVGWFSAAQIVSALSWQIDRGLLGYFVSRAALGRYTMASDLSVLPTQSVVGPAMQPVMAAFARISSDPDRLARAYVRASQVAMAISVPLSVGLALTSNLIVRVLLGPRWLGAAPYLSGLALAVMPAAYFQPLYALALASNRPAAIFRLNLAEIALKLVAVMYGLWVYALPGVVIARASVSIVMFFAVTLTARRMVGVSVRAQLGGLWKVALAAAVMVSAAFALMKLLQGHPAPLVAQLLVIAGGGGATYAAALFALRFRLRA